MHTDIRSRLQYDNAKLRALGADLAALVSTRSPCDPEQLARKRWELSRMVHQHLIYLERHIFRPLAEHPQPEVRKAVDAFKREIEQLHGAYKLHVETWRAPDVAARWEEFQAAVKAMVVRMKLRLDREERELFALAPDAPDPGATWQPGMRNWAGDALLFQAAIRAAVSDGAPPLVPATVAAGGERAVLYVSQSVIGDDDVALAALAAQAQAANAELGITGALIATGDRFAQFLEGPALPVAELMSRIDRDPRHGEVTIVRTEAITQRSLPDCALAYSGPSSDAAQELVQLAGTSPAPERDVQLLDLLKGLARR